MTIEARRSYGNSVNGETPSDIWIHCLPRYRFAVYVRSRAEPSTRCLAVPVPKNGRRPYCMQCVEGGGVCHLTAMGEVLENTEGVKDR